MTDIQDTRVIHGNYGHIEFDGTVIGRVQNTTMRIDGSSNEFYETGTPWTTQVEAVNKNVKVEIQRGLVDFLFTAYAMGAYADLSDDAPSFADDNGNYNLLGVEGDGSSDVEVGISEVNKILSGQFKVDVILVTKKIINGVLTEIRAKALDCTVITSEVSAPNNDYWVGSISLTGTKFITEGTPIEVTE